jgi:hypothetical protein
MHLGAPGDAVAETARVGDGLELDLDVELKHVVEPQALHLWRALELALVRANHHPLRCHLCIETALAAV